MGPPLFSLSPLCQIVVEKVQPSPFHEIRARKLHHLPNLLPIISAIALGFAFLAHGLGVMGTPKTLSNTIGQKSRTGFAELDSPIDEGRYLFKWWGEGLLRILPMVFPAKDMDKPNEDLDILFLLTTQGHGNFPPV
jgi:hypothetical protein